MYDLRFKKFQNLICQTSEKLLRDESIFLGFTTRIGGFSITPYDSLNLAFHVGDKEESVFKNRIIAGKELEFDINNLTCAEQVHSSNVEIITLENMGAGAKQYDTAIKNTDALITKEPRLALAMFFADCLPVVLIGLEPRIIAVIHAGYKGLLEGVIENTIDKMKETVDTEKLFAFLGPAIGPCCYTVEEKRINLFYEKFPSIIDKTNLNLNLSKIAAFILKQKHLKPDNIISSNMCTSCNTELFYSYRKYSTTGRHSAIAYLL